MTRVSQHGQPMNLHLDFNRKKFLGRPPTPRLLFRRPVRALIWAVQYGTSHLGSSGLVREAGVHLGNLGGADMCHAHNHNHLCGMCPDVLGVEGNKSGGLPHFCELIFFHLLLFACRCLHISVWYIPLKICIRGHTLSGFNQHA